MTLSSQLIMTLLLSFSVAIQAAPLDTPPEKQQVQLFYPQHSADFYSATQQLWHSTSASNALENQLALLVLAQLNSRFSHRYEQLQQAQGQDYDRLATDTLLYLLTYQEQVKQHGARWLFAAGMPTDIGPPSAATLQRLSTHLNDNTLLELVLQLRPSSAQYRPLYRKLYDYYSAYPQASPKLHTSQLLKPEQVIPYRSLIAHLRVAGDVSQVQEQRLLAMPSSRYHTELVAIVRSFQARHGLRADGIIGKDTLFWLNMDAGERVRLMALNIQRLRLWQAQQNRLVLVNIPAYEMAYWNAGKRLFESRVIVGTTERKTPLLRANLDSIVFNPSWHVPTVIMREDILPKALRDRRYLLTHNFDVVPTWLSKKVIPVTNIDWSRMTADNFPYKLRQRAGNHNALGRYKFNTPNHNAIFMHDTPTRALFRQQRRAYSSGCIRLERAADFARLLMTESNFSNQEYFRYQQLPNTKHVGLRQRITMQVIYQTAWVDEYDRMQFRNDVYSYDMRQPLSTALQPQLKQFLSPSLESDNHKKLLSAQQVSTKLAPTYKSRSN